MRIALCTNFVSPYRVPVFRAIARTPGVELDVYVSGDSESDREWSACDHAGEPFTVCRTRGVTRARTVSSGGDHAFDQRVEQHVPIGLFPDLLKRRPDVVISGELGARTIIARFAANVMRVPMIPWTYHPKAQADLMVGAKGVRRKLVAGAPAVIGMGTQARSVLEGAGCDPAKIFDAPNAADTESIAARLVSAVHRQRVNEIWSRFGDARIALIVGRPVPMKGIDRVCDAWSELPADVRYAWRLVHVGTPATGALRERMDDAGVESVGHVDASEMPDWFVAADLHVFASLGDPWGLVVNEAMQCGTPTLCSVRAGCCDDLVRDGDDGFTFDPGAHSHAIAGELERAMRSEELADMGVRAQHRVRAFTPEAMASGFVRAARSVLARTTTDGRGDRS